METGIGAVNKPMSIAFIFLLIVNPKIKSKNEKGTIFFVLIFKYQ
jgi:hypothetical protein